VKQRGSSSSHRTRQVVESSSTKWWPQRPAELVRPFVVSLVVIGLIFLIFMPGPASEWFSRAVVWVGLIALGLDERRRRTQRRAELDNQKRLTEKRPVSVSLWFVVAFGLVVVAWFGLIGALW
jgi:hypothetical protein